MDFNTLKSAVNQDAAIRRVRRLQPVGGPGDKVFPPTYPGLNKNDPPLHVKEKRRIDGQDKVCVLIDSVQSQANRLEEALLTAHRAGRITLPLIRVDFTNACHEGRDVSDIGEITSLDAPHRVFDAIIRDSEKDGKTFKQTDIGNALVHATMRNAESMFAHAPTALLFGAWNSTGEGGGLGAKFPRCIVSEIVGVDAPTEEGKADRQTGQIPEVLSGQRTGSRIDPLGIRAAIKVYGENDDWQFENNDKKKEKKPSAINHGNIAPSIEPLGVTVEYAQHTAVITCAGLRRLGFIDENGVIDEGRDTAARAVLAALGLFALVEQDRQGYALRSRCDLVAEDPSAFEIVHPDGRTDSFTLDADEALALLKCAIAAAEAAGLPWNADGITLTPQPKMVRLVAESRAIALAGKAETETG